MEQLQVRGYEPGDDPAVATLANLVEEHAGGHPGVTSDEIRGVFSSIIRDVAADSRLVFEPGGELVGLAGVPSPPEGGYRSDLFGGVHPNWRGRGVGRDLLGWQLDRVAEIHRKQAPQDAWEAHTHAVAGDEDARRLFERFGLTPVRYWLEMAAPTAQIPACELPDGLGVVTFSPGHEKGIYQANAEAFRDHWGYQLRDRDTWATLTIRSEDFRPDLSVIAFDGTEIAGYVLSYDDPDPNRLYVGQVGVRRPWRRRGVASGLLARVLTAAARAGKQNVALGVDAESPTGAVGVYERVGFAVEYRAVTYATPIIDRGSGVPPGSGRPMDRIAST